MAMKKTNVMMLALAVIVSACSKEAPESGKPGDKKMIDVVFDAQSDDTKTVLDGKTVKWEKGDSISIIWGTDAEDQTKAYASASGASTTFPATVAEADNYYAVYPASVVASKSSSEEYELLLNVPKTQYGSFSRSNITVASTTKEEMSLSFKNLCALVKFELSRSDVKEVRFKGNNNESVVGDGVQVKLGTTPSVVGINTTRKETIIKPASSTTFDAGTYYFAILPGQFSKGFTFTVKTSDDKIASKFTDKDFTFVRSKAVAVGVIDNIFNNLYATPSGSGTMSGDSWANALSAAGLRDLLSSASATAEATRIAKLQGATIRLAGGTYVLADETTKYLPVSFSEIVNLAFEGGYNSSTGIRESSQETIFSGNKDRAIFSLNSKLSFTFDRITFKDALAVAASIDVARGALTVTDLSVVANINSCKFIDNIENSGLSQTAKEGGSAIFLSNGYVYVKNTLFKNNKSQSRGGAVRTEAGVMFMDKCQFVDNVLTRDAYGMAMFTKSNLGLNNCTFWGGTAPSGKNNPVLNVNNNFILSNNTLIGATTFSSGTGVVRSETEKGYTGLMINNIIINSSTTATSWGMLFSKTDKKTLSEGSNLYSGFSDGVSHTARVDLSESDKNVMDYKTLGTNLSYSLDPNTNEVVWTGSWTDYSKADAATVKTTIESFTATSGKKDLGKAFSAWLGL